MANLSYPDLKKRQNMHKFCDKVFGRKGNDGGDNENNWNVKGKGIFMSEYVEIDKVKYKKWDEDLPTILISAKKNPGIYLYGRYPHERNIKKVNMTTLDKSAEFGGQGSQGNKGHQFEAVLDARLNECVSSRCCKGQYDDEAKHLIELVSKDMGASVKSVTLEGGRNQPRPVKVQGGQPYIEPYKPVDHGKKVTDITMHMGNNKDAYLSLKSGDTLTFINSGVSKEFFPMQEMKKGMVKKKDGIALLDMWGINNAKFCQIFNQYGSGTKMDDHIVDVTSLVDKTKLKKFMQTAIGAGYFMVHETNGKIKYWYISASENKKYANVDGCKFTAYYGGKSGKGKRIDIEFENAYYFFSMNIRNKQSGIYPSHIMMDYTSLSGIKKTTLGS